MAALLGATIDFLHASLMAAWVLGLPLLFSSRWPRLSRAYALYAIVFVTINELSLVLLRECFLTTLARMAWQRSDGLTVSHEWFTVRLAKAVFHLTPTHRSIKIMSEAFIFVTACGVAFRGFHGSKGDSRKAHA